MISDCDTLCLSRQSFPASSRQVNLLCRRYPRKTITDKRGTQSESMHTYAHAREEETYLNTLIFQSLGNQEQPYSPLNSCTEIWEFFPVEVIFFFYQRGQTALVKTGCLIQGMPNFIMYSSFFFPNELSAFKNYIYNCNSFQILQ